MKIREIIDALEQFAPLPLQEDWDNAGLQVGLTGTEVSGVLLCLDVNEEIVDEAVSRGCNLIVSHHPLLFHGLKQITDNAMVPRVVIRAIQSNITIVSMHTNMDNAVGGVNWVIGERLGLRNLQFLRPQSPNGDLTGGSGAIGELDEPVAADEFIAKVKETFGCGCVMTNELLKRPIRTVALCGGAGAFLLDDAIAQRADCFITGEMHYHEYFAHEQEIQIMVIGHYESEQYTSEIFRNIIADQFPDVPTYIAQTNTNPIQYR